MQTGKLLIVDDNKNVLKALNIFLKYEFETVKCISNPNKIALEFRKTDFDVVLLDMNFTSGLNTGNEGFFWFNEIKKLSPLTELVMFTAYGDVELAVKAVKAGAADFIVKPWDNEKMISTLKAAQKMKETKAEVRNLKIKQQGLKQALNPDKKLIAGRSDKMLRVMEMVSKIADTDANILITGENGTGKEMIASEIHRLSKRKHELMVTVDMGSIPDTLFESELFGHKKGAFTDAVEDKTGKFELAHKGTLFLDEIGNLPLASQSKLLVALQNRQINPLGSTKHIDIDIRLISATNYKIDSLITLNKFREDLLYRINTIQIEIPPLRNRIEDVEPLTMFFLQKYAKKYKKEGLQINESAIRRLENYDWPGNIRELEHSIEKAVILSTGKTIKLNDLPLKTKKDIKPERIITIGEMEKDMILKAIKIHNNNYTEAAEQLGITRQTLYNKMKKYGI